MEVLSGPWADLALLLRQTMVQTDRETDSFFPLWLFGLLLFLSVCLLLLQLIAYLSWKIRQVEEDLVVENRSALYRQMNSSADRSRKTVG